MGRVKTEKTGKTGKTGRPRRARYGLAFAACVLMAGCAELEADDTKKMTDIPSERQNLQMRPEKVYIPTDKKHNHKHIVMAQVPDMDKYTLVSSEPVYNPLHDPSVRKAYRRVYNDGTKIIYSIGWKYPGHLYDKNTDQILLSRARDRFYTDIVTKTNCHVILTSGCSTYMVSPNLGLRKLGNSTSSCGPFFSTNYHAIGARHAYTGVSQEFDLVFDPDFEDSLKWFFGFRCENGRAIKPKSQNWKRRK